MAYSPSVSTSPAGEVTARIRHLYGKFRLREDNPEGFDAKLKHWFFVINEFCRDHRHFLFTPSEVRQNFKCGTVYPDSECLRLVCSNMVRRSVIVKKCDFSLQSNNNEGWISWGLKTFKKPLSLGRSLLGRNPDDLSECDVISEDIKMDTEFVNREALDFVSQDLLKALGESHMIGRTLRMEEFTAFIRESWPIKDKQLDFLIKHLEKEGQAAVAVEKDIKFIKFGNGAKFSDIDLAIAKLDLTRKYLEQECDKIADQIEEMRIKACEVLKARNRVAAKNVLRSKKAAEKLLQNKESQLLALDSLLTRLQNVDSTKMLIDACKVYPELCKTKLGGQDVDSVLANVEDAIKEYEDINFEINSLAPGIDNAELEEELQSLLDEDAQMTPSKSRTNTIEEVLDLPRVPDASPTSDLEGRLRNLRSKQYDFQ